MSRLQTMTNLRGGVAYRAADVSPTTARSWPVEVGTSRGEGHKRYDLTDVVVLTIMRTLTVSRAVSAAHAAWIVHGLQPHLPELVNSTVLELERDMIFRWDGFPMAVVSGSVEYPNSSSIRIFPSDEGFIEYVSDRRSGQVPLILPLQRLILRAIYSLGSVIHGDKLPYDEDGTLPMQVVVK